MISIFPALVGKIHRMQVGSEKVCSVFVCSVRGNLACWSQIYWCLCDQTMLMSMGVVFCSLSGKAHPCIEFSHSQVCIYILETLYTKVVLMCLGVNVCKCIPENMLSLNIHHHLSTHTCTSRLLGFEMRPV